MQFWMWGLGPAKAAARKASLKCESRVEMPQVSTKTLPPGGSCHGAAVGGAMTDEECGR